MLHNNDETFEKCSGNEEIESNHETVEKEIMTTQYQLLLEKKNELLQKINEKKKQINNFNNNNNNSKTMKQVILNNINNNILNQQQAFEKYNYIEQSSRQSLDSIYSEGYKVFNQFYGFSIVTNSSHSDHFEYNHSDHLIFRFDTFFENKYNEIYFLDIKKTEGHGKVSCAIFKHTLPYWIPIDMIVGTVREEISIYDERYNRDHPSSWQICLDKQLLHESIQTILKSFVYRKEEFNKLLSYHSIAYYFHNESYSHMEVRVNYKSRTLYFKIDYSQLTDCVPSHINLKENNKVLIDSPVQVLNYELYDRYPSTSFIQMEDATEKCPPPTPTPQRDKIIYYPDSLLQLINNNIPKKSNSINK
ncbi:hypothetical protein CYY_005375 [Polysphondylium violaceum]|uniref:Uncharacterized protein n=1 Tax=Polysphondylium violaceum TaxID=133409 RepID=A0A8J4V491_9MYCE|nr:hypothetical protein CYY_005375 [Polysphondylium violaceum]